MRADTIDKFKAYFGLGSMIVIVGTMTLAVIDAFIDIKRDLLIAGIGFLGSIIGGAITLIGVNITLKNQYREEFFKSYPEKRKASVLVDRILNDALYDFEEKYEDDDKEELESAISIFLEQEEMLLEKASKISVSHFELVFDFIEYTKKVHTISVHQEEINNGTQFRGLDETDIEQCFGVMYKITEYISRLNHRLSDYYEEIAPFKRHY
ncbi:hypothetical protein [Brevibacillus sp. Leaf182]|uniref:hypothetical protein n=1 Tax=Brevibacillus sp. Leaf182 TaxID=1736290 RepID=UPI0006FF56D7|nr:hypothetical protein [Brevibacillus sp. Leaf182]RAT95949.1 hypothetical protein ASG16_019360 [Brevibacillus sp. Leaf182]